jgi:hypothetical protein
MELKSKFDPVEDISCGGGIAKAFGGREGVEGVGEGLS